MSEDFKAVSENITPHKTLDVKGMSCPMPLLRAKKEIEKINSGEILEILGTDPGSRKDFPGWAARSGHEYLGEKEEAGFFRYYIRKK
jgi:tRNA 2-thiouridine synthesizing protein A